MFSRWDREGSRHLHMVPSGPGERARVLGSDHGLRPGGLQSPRAGSRAGEAAPQFSWSKKLILAKESRTWKPRRAALRL